MGRGANTHTAYAPSRHGTSPGDEVPQAAASARPTPERPRPHLDGSSAVPAQTGPEQLMAEIGGLSNEIAVARAVRENAAADLRIMAPELAGKLVEELTACGIQDRLFKNYVGQMPYFEYHLIPVERRRGRLNRTKEKSMALVAMEFDRGDVSYHLLHDPAAGTDSERPVSRYNLGFGRRAELASPEVLAEFVQDLPRIIDHLRNKLNANGQRLVNAAAKAEQAWGLDWSLDRSAAASA